MLSKYEDKAKSLLGKSLDPRNVFYKLIGTHRIDQYILNGIDPYEAYLYFIEKLPFDKVKYIERHLLGLELNIYVYEKVKEAQARNVQFEKPFCNTKADVYAVIIKGPRILKGFTKYEPIKNNILNNRNKKSTCWAELVEGEHSFEAKTSKELRDDVCVQLNQVKKYNPRIKRHVVVPKGTIISKQLAMNICKNGEDILIAPLDINDLKYRFRDVIERCKAYEEICGQYAKSLKNFRLSRV